MEAADKAKGGGEVTVDDIIEVTKNFLTFSSKASANNANNACANNAKKIFEDGPNNKVDEDLSNKSEKQNHTEPELDLASASSTDENGGKKINMKPFVPPVDWANAPEFVPRSFVPSSSSSALSSSASSNGPSADSSANGESSNAANKLPSYAEVAGHGLLPVELSLGAASPDAQLCPYAMVGECRFGVKCAYLHGLKCEFCGMAVLHPLRPEQREQHSKECVAQHEKDMELSFAVARSSDKTCGICMEVVMEKTPSREQRFGILPSCIHCFCLSCIRKWRQARQFENKIIRACPECRVTSDYVCPSRYWVETKEEKEKLITSYLESLSKKPCRYYRNGSGECPFGNKCFYLHAGPDGTPVDVGPPRRRVRRNDQNRPVDSGPVSIWEFLEAWEMRWFEIEDLLDLMDSDDNSIWSDGDGDDFDWGPPPLEGEDLSDLRGFSNHP